MVHFNVSCCFVLLLTSVLINSLDLSSEKEHLEQMIKAIEDNLQVINSIQEKNSIHHNQNQSAYRCNSEKECANLISINHYANKEVTLDNFANINLEQKIVNFHLFNHMFEEFKIKEFEPNETTNEHQTKTLSSLKLVIIFTVDSIIVTKINGERLTIYNLNLALPIIKVDFSFFEEDSSIVLMTENAEVSYINLSVKVSGQSVHVQYCINFLGFKGGPLCSNSQNYSY